jgi:4-hydroxybenzoyl-CoA thioesterase
MSLVSSYTVTVEWGDCDPAQIVFYPKYFEWFDAAMTWLLEAGGWSYVRLLEDFGIIGLPLAEASARFLRPSRFRQRLEIRSSVERWEERRFTVLHQAYRDDVLLLEGRETRICGKPYPDDPQRLLAVPIPPEFREAFEK